jgi:hypothetical protein
MKTRYWEYPEHDGLADQFSPSIHHDGGLYLYFCLDFAGLLPTFDAGNRYGSGETDGSLQRLAIVLRDTEDGKTYRASLPCCLEKCSEQVFNHKAGEVVTVTQLQDYFFSAHFCPCHRKAAALDGGADTDEECTGDRFLVERITVQGSDLILYSEVYSADELKRLLDFERVP